MSVGSPGPGMVWYRWCLVSVARLSCVLSSMCRAMVLLSASGCEGGVGGL